MTPAHGLLYCQRMENEDKIREAMRVAWNAEVAEIEAARVVRWCSPEELEAAEAALRAAKEAAREANLAAFRLSACSR